jgi:hypothetical protein
MTILLLSAAHLSLWAKDNSPRKIRKKNLAGLLWDTPEQTIFLPDAKILSEKSDSEVQRLSFTEKLRIQSALTNGTLNNAELWSNLFQKQVEGHLFELSELEGQTQLTLRGSVARP